MLRVVTFKWATPGYRSTFEARHVDTLAAMVRRHYRAPHEFVCVTDDARGIDRSIRIVPLWDDYARVPNPHGARNPSCYRRLKLFAPEARELIGERFVVLDLDAVILRDLGPIFDRPEDFVIWGDTARGTPYNGSLWLLRAGTRRQVWETFEPRRSPQIGKARGYIGSDQAWIGVCLGPHEAKYGPRDGIYSFRNEILAKRRGLPPDARMILFHGQYDPWMPLVQRAHPWICQHYRV